MLKAIGEGGGKHVTALVIFVSRVTVYPNARDSLDGIGSKAGKPHASYCAVTRHLTY